MQAGQRFGGEIVPPAHSHHDDGHHHPHGHGAHGQWTAAAHATLHCSIGCVIGETAGLLSVSLGFPTLASMALATLLAYVCGFALAMAPLMRRTGLSMGATFSAIWLGETISIGVMEVMMNAIDYDLGGVRTGSIFHPQFWSALIVAIIAGFLAAWPVNAWLIAKQLRKGH